MKTNKLLSVLSILVIISLNAYGQVAKTQSNQDKVTAASPQPDSVQAVMCHIGIGDYVWLDTDADGYQDGGENGINDVQLKLYWRKHTYDSWQLYDTQTTRYGNGKKGYYFFSYTDSEADALIPGYFKVDVVESTLPPGLTLTTNNEPFVKYFNYWEYYYKADFGYTPGKPSLEILTEFEVSCAKMVYNTTGWVKNTGDAGGDVAEDVHFWYVVKDPANEKYIDDITFSGDFTNLVGQEQREVGLTITMTDEWKNTAYNTEIQVWIYAEPTNRPGHVAKETLHITSHWGQKIIIEKQTTPDGSTQEFDFNGAIDTNLKDNQTSTKQVGIGTYKVNEVVPAGWTLTNITVNDGNSTVDIPNGEVTFNVEANETVKAVFYNRQDAKIIIEKQTDPDGSPQSFDFDGEIDVNLTDGQSQSKTVVPGTYSVNENVPAGWTLTDIVITDPTGNSTKNVGTGSVSFDVSAGETVKAVFHNRQDAKIIIEKQTDPDGSPQSFDFDGEIDVNLTDGQSQSKTVVPGTYSVNENVPAGWTLTDIVITDPTGNSTKNVGAGSVSFDVSAGETVKAVFHNRQDAKIIIEKQTDPDGSPQSFDFDGEIDINLTDGQSSSKTVVPGTYSVNENVPAGWTLTDIVITDPTGNSTKNVGAGSVSFDVSAGETVKAVFHNRQDAKIIIEKQTDPDGSPQSFDFDGEIDINLTDGQSQSKTVVPGTYSVNENVPAGWTLTDIVITDPTGNSSKNLSAGSVTFNVSVGETVKAVFHNRQDAKIIIEKQTDPDGSPQSFDFDGEIDINLTDGQSQSKTVVPGTYSVNENVPAGWTLTDIVITDPTGNSTKNVGAGSVSFDVSAGETVKAVFHNRQDAKIIIEKQTDPDGSPQSFDFDGEIDINLTDGQSQSKTVVPGTYSVNENVPAGWTLTDIVITDPTGNSTKNVGAGSVSFDVSAGETVKAVFHNRQKAGLGDKVWYDVDRDGVQDVGESGVSGVTVKLYDSGDNLQGTTTTNGVGIYGFSNLNPGDYYVEFSNLPAGYEITNPNQGGDDSKDSDANPTTGKTANINLSAGETDLTWDAGIREKLGSIGDYVWYDTDRDGVQDAGETGVSGVTVKLYDSSDNLKGTTTTNGSGIYGFSNLEPGDYYVEFSNLPAGYEFSNPDQGSDDAKDSDADKTTGKTSTISLSLGEVNKTLDAGINQPPASLGDYVWYDVDRDGIQDVGESGVSGVTVKLYDSGDNLKGTTTTNGSGIYGFSNLNPGDYYVEFSNLPAGYEFSNPNQGSDDAKDSDADKTTGKTATISLSAGETDLTWDAGIRIKLGSIGDYVWYDTDRDGVQDAGETGVSGVTVKLYDSGDNLKGTTTTNGSGIYGFNNLNPGTYYVEFSNLPAGYEFSNPDQGSDDAKDSDADKTTGKTATTSLSAGETDLTWDAGISQPPASLGDFVWYDVDRDGVQDIGEGGVSGVTVKLYDSGDNLKGTTTTNGSGIYGFNNINPGTYYVEFSNLPAGYEFSNPNQGSDDAKDSDADKTTGKTATISLSAGETDLTWDAGIRIKLGSIGDYVWYDTDRDGVQDAGETGVSGVTVKLYDSGDNLKGTTTTNGSGIYGFNNLNPGTYYVEFSNLPAGYEFSNPDQGSDDAKDSDADKITGKTATISLSAGETDLTWDAGISQPPASLGDYVWYDVDRDGIQDVGETGVSGVTVKLYDSGDNLKGTTTTNGSGIYGFNNINPGTYYVEFSNLPAGYEFSNPDQGSDDAKDSDADKTTGKTATISLSAGETDLTWDAGIRIKLGSIGDYVWNDTDRDGIQDAGETGVDNVTVKLFKASDNSQVGPTKLTDINGKYLFINIPAGTYYVEFSNIPAGYEFTTANAGADNVDSDANTTTGKTANINLSAGETDLTWDAGIRIKLGSIGDYVWYDVDRDGIQDTGETGVSDVTVKLFKASDNTQVGSTQTTDVNGAYLFNNVPAGTYYVEFSNLPAGYEFTTANAGADNVDSDANTTTGKTANINLSAGETDLTWDAGIRTKLGSIGDYVWYDVDRDGIQDAGETGVSGVTVKLYDSGDNLKGTTTTNGSGMYGFNNLNPGTYYVEFSNLPAGYQFSNPNQGGDDAKDSDADKTTGKTSTISLSAGEINTTLDAGINQPPASLGNYVWYDTNMNGIQDQGESGIENVTVRLYRQGESTYFAQKTTNSSGLYNFQNLNPGNYLVEFILPINYFFSPQDQGSDNDLDSDADVTTGKTVVTNLSPGETDNSWDAGMIQYASFGNYVWLDLNRNGIQDSNELGINGVEVFLYMDTDGDGKAEPNGDDGAFVKKTTTATYLGNPGYYNFTKLIPGDYFIAFELPVGFVFSDKNQGSNDKDSDADQTTGVTDVTTLDPGENDETWDAGVYSTLGSLGDYVWLDINQNGIQEIGEPGIENVEVRLYNIRGELVKIDYTDNRGNYLFDKLSAAKYQIEFVLPSQQYGFTLKNQGNYTEDSNADRTTGRTEMIELKEGRHDMTWDAGMYFMIPLGGRKRIIARYQPWYGDAENDSTLRYWDKNYFGGHTDTSLFDFYDSYDSDMHEYQILHAWASGIDGFAVDWFGKNSYENPALKDLLDKADSLYQKFSYRGFDFEIAASYNERAKDRLDTNFIYLGNKIMEHPAYWGKRRGVRRPVFIYNEVEDTIITPSEYRSCGDTTLPNDYFLLWNNTEKEAFEPMDVMYPWVNTLNDTWDDVQGLNWGETYLDTTYYRMNYVAKPGDLLFALGAVWPGFDDRDWSQTENHWMSRQDTLVYELTWEKVHEYGFNYSLPMNWVMIETWNDYNRATEIEPSIEHDYKFTVLTRDHARRFKSTIPPDSVGVDNPGLLVPQHILQARRAAELRPQDASTITVLIDYALDRFFDRKYYEALSIADYAAGIAPKPFSLDSVSESSVTIHWDKAEHANAYIICYSQDAAAFEPASFKRPEVVLVGDINNYTLTGLDNGSTYYIAVVAANTNLGLYANFSWYESTITGAKVKSFTTSVLKNTTSVQQNDSSIPTEFALKQNYPNPFNPSTIIEYDLPRAQNVIITIYDIRGRVVEKLVNEYKPAGRHSVEFYADDLASGVYFYRIQTEEFTRLHKMMLLK